MWILSGLMSLVCLKLVAGQEGPIVETADGAVLGRTRISQMGNEYSSFERIPFASPPIGTLRFGSPQPNKPWEGILDGSVSSTTKCIQYGYISDGEGNKVSGSEDCLYLNVYAPKQISKEPKAVMMWIYGGSLTAGSNQFNEYGSIRWMDQDVILVVPNYRLGPFGFTSLGIDDAPGNQGFLDLVQALRWINTNIEFFGGDPGRVTIFGESSGSWAVSYLAISPLANGLFQRGIMQSGGLFNPFWTWRTQEDAIQLGGFLAENLGCSKDGNTDQMLECLQEVSVDALEDSINWGTEETYGIQKILRPTGIIDGKFLPANPVNLMERGEYNHVDLMVGVTKDEGLLQMYQLELNPELYVVASIFWNSIFGPMFLFGRFGNYDITEEDKEMTNLITKYYLGEPGAANINQQHFQNMTDMISDAYIWYGSHKQAEWAAAHGDNVYKYMFTFKGTYGFADAFGLDNSKYGVCHADELYYFWKPYWKKAAIQMTPAEELVAERMLNSWANFAKYGDPSIPGSDINWSPLTAENQEYMNIGEEWKMEISEDYVNRMRAWDEIYKYPTGNTLPTIPLGEQTGDRILN